MELATLARADAGGPATAHGTHVASIIFAQPDSGLEGIAPSCRGLIIPVFSDENPDGKLTCSQLDLARAIGLAIENGAHIINISGGQLTPSGEPEPLLARAIESCTRHNVLIVAAAGNDGCECLHVPAASPSVLAVGAMDQQGDPLVSSNWGAAYLTQGILAPGQGIPGATPGGGTARKSGTSFATPYVAGLAGLLASQQIKNGQSPDPHGIRSAILRSALPCPPGSAADCRKYLSGRLNISGAIDQLAKGKQSMSDAETINPFEMSEAAPETRLERRPASQALQMGRILAADGIGASNANARAFSPSEIAPDSTPKPATSVRAAEVTPSDCGCGGGGSCSCGGAAAQKPALVYALGKIGYDFGTEARRDSLVQAMPIDANNAADPEQWLAHLEASPYDAPSVIWTLNLDATPVYAIQPAGPFAETGYLRLREFLQGQMKEGVELVSIPGVVAGGVRLLSGQVVPVIVPTVRGMFSWATAPLVQHVLGVRPTDDTAQASYDNLSGGLSDFLNRVYYDLRNLGITAEERALNYAATNAVQIASVIRSTTRDELDLDTIGVKKSPVCRPDSDCYDVELSFFNPHNTNVANRVFRFTVDVSDVIPVTVGEVRNWTRRSP